MGRYAGGEPLILTPQLRTAATAEAQATAEPPERRAANDLGGRIDPALGWTPSVPDASSARSIYAQTVAASERPST